MLLAFVQEAEPKKAYDQENLCYWYYDGPSFGIRPYPWVRDSNHVLMKRVLLPYANHSSSYEITIRTK